MNWKEFADEYEKVLDNLVATSEYWTEDKQRVKEARSNIASIRSLPEEKQQLSMSKFKEREVKAMFLKLKA